MLESVGYANEQASGLRALSIRKTIPILTVRGTGSGAGASLVVAGLAHGLGRYYRTLVLDLHSGRGSLAAIMGLRVRFDGRSVVNGEVPWSRVRVPVVPQVDYIGLGRGAVERATSRHWHAMDMLMRQYDLVVVDGDSQVLGPVFGGRVPLTLLVADGARSTGGVISGMFTAPLGPVGLVINRVDHETDCQQILDGVRRWIGGCGEVTDFGRLPLAPSDGSGRQWRAKGMGDLHSLSLPEALVRLPEVVQAWLEIQVIDSGIASCRVSGQGMDMRA